MSNDKENSFYVPLTGILVSIKTITTTTTKTEIVMPAFRPKLINFFLILLLLFYSDTVPVLHL